MAASIRDLRVRNWVTASGVFLLFFIAFRWGWHLLVLDRALSTTAFSDFYSGFQNDSDALVIGRLEQNRIDGVLSGGISLGLGGSYTSQVGAGGWALTLIPSLLGLPASTGIWLMYTIIAAMNAVLATAAVWTLRRTLSLGAAVLASAAILQPWSVAMARSIYWMIGLKLLPAVGLIILFRLQKQTRWRVLAISGVTSCLVFLSGYEFLTVVIACQLAVVSYYSVRSKWTLSQTIAYLGCVLAGVASAFAAALTLHFTQLLLRLDSAAAALQKIEDTISKRTGATGLDVDPVYAASLASSPSQVLDTYLNMPVFGAPFNLPLVRYFTVATLMALCLVIIVYAFRTRRERPQQLREQGLGLAWIVAIVGPIGWFLLARPHSFIHTHINFALWFLPTVPLGLAILWRPLRDGVVGLGRLPVAVGWILAVTAALAIFYAYSLVSMRP